jgi:predicted hydrocarbon binding protein
LYKPKFLKLQNTVISFLIRFPFFPKLLFFPWLRIPFIAKRIPLVVRALLGGGPLALHEHLPLKGRISIGGVDETIWCSRIFHVLKRKLAQELGEERKDAFILEAAEEMGWFEADAAINSGKWLPKSYQPMFDDLDLLKTVRNNNELAKLFTKTMNIAIRLIFNEGGWGNVKSFDITNDPIRITMDHLQEPLHSGPANRPVCLYIRGYLSGFLSRLLHRKMKAEELECAAQGGSECVFAIHIQK